MISGAPEGAPRVDYYQLTFQLLVVFNGPGGPSISFAKQSFTCIDYWLSGALRAPCQGILHSIISCSARAFGPLQRGNDTLHRGPRGPCAGVL